MMLDGRNSVSELELRAALNDYERVIRSSELLSKRGGQLAAVLSTFYAMWSAFAVRLRSRECGKDKIASMVNEPLVGYGSVDSESLPSLDAVQSAAEKFIIGLTLHDVAAMSRALDEMGILDLCPTPGEQLARAEGVARRITGRRRLVLIIELALIAVELGQYDQAGEYANEARAFHPTSWELYNLCIVEGLIALDNNRRADAVECLRESIVGCLSDEYTLLSCGVRVPNLLLAQRLLCSGERVEVVNHLSQCKMVWPFLRLRIDKWISSVKKGSIPDTRISGVLDSLNFAYRLQMQWMRTASLENEHISSPKSAAEAIAGRERLRTEYKSS